MKILQTAERVSQYDKSDNYVFQRSLLAYVEAAKIVSGKVLEIGTGSGYGIEIISSQADQFVTIDKFEPTILSNDKIATDTKIKFMQMTIPPIVGIDDNTFDYVVSFQVIEHIKKDDQYVSEIHRVLKPGGKFIVTTPNIKMSLTRNPWHIREYTVEELNTLLKKEFSNVDKMGVFGNEKIIDYHEKNKASIKKFTRFDIFNLQYNLPRQLLQIPYDIANRMNRRKLLNDNNSLVSGIKMDDFFIGEANDQCLDLFYIATK